MIKRYEILSMLMCAVALLWSSCAREQTPDPTQAEGPQLRISIDQGFTTRSALTTTGESQHIEAMYAYLFHGTGMSASCFYAVQLPWEPNSSEQASDLVFRLQHAQLGQYGSEMITVLVVGVDNNGTTYNFPIASATEDHLTGMIGRTLGEVKAVLADAVVGEDGALGSDLAAKAYAMAHTELFSGTVETEASAQEINVSILRCVAGILCYLTDIPYLIQSGEPESRVQRVELRLNSTLQLNTSLDLCDKPAIGSEPLTGSDGCVIASVDLSSYQDAQGESGAQMNLLYIPPRDDGSVQTLENSVLFGAYLVPIAVDEQLNSSASDDATLKIVLIGGTDPAVATYTQSYNVRNVAGTDPTADDRPYTYSLEANRLYAIGTKPLSNSTSEDVPASLSGNELTLDVTPWTEIPGDVEFPSYALAAYFQTHITEQTLFDCVGSTFSVQVMPPAGGEAWSLRVQTSDGEQTPEWLHFRIQQSDGSYGSWMTSYTSPINVKEPVTVQVALNDYVVMNDIMGNSSLSIVEKIMQLENDYRTAEVVLSTEGAATTDALPIKQYNAITAPLNDSKNPTYPNDYRGFARKDLLKPDFDDDFRADAQNYSYTEWGLNETAPMYIFGHVDSEASDGEANCINAYNYAMTGDFGSPENYKLSCLYRARQEWTLIEDNVEVATGRYWFLPAWDELKGFFNYVVLPIREYYGTLNQGVEIPVVNVKYGLYYWSSCPYVGLPRRYAWAYSIDTKIHEDYKDKDGINAYIRQARKFE